MAPARPLSSPASETAAALLAAFEAAGIRDIVLSPGSRSQALALAAAEFERAGRLRLHVRLDERSAGFLALGLAIETALPALVVTTSGTAVANFHPAVLEAHHSGVPLILLTADRPSELRGIGSNQTTHQTALFGEALRFIRDVETPRSGPIDAGLVDSLVGEAMSAALGRSSAAEAPAVPGPAQLNIAFREPLSAHLEHLPEPPASRAPSRPWRPESPSSEILDLPVDSDPGTVVIAGHAAGPDAEKVAYELGAPLLAEASSAARYGRNLVPGYREVLDDPALASGVRRAIVFGHPTLSRQIPALLQEPDVDVVIVRGPVPEAYDPSRGARVVDAVRVIGASTANDPAHRAWIARWVERGRAATAVDHQAPDLSAALSADNAVRARFLRDEVEIIRRPVTRRSLAEALWAVTWPHDRLVLGASRLIREVDQVVPGKKIAVHANRGLAGIDGTIATATGIGLASQAGSTTDGNRLGWADGSRGITRVLVGDLTFFHDAGSLLFGAGEAKPRIQVIVGNDGGGTIFDGLEVASVAPPEAMTRVQLTPQAASIEGIAVAYGWEYRRVTTRGDLDQALVGSSGPIVIEVPLER